MSASARLQRKPKPSEFRMNSTLIGTKLKRKPKRLKQKLTPYNCDGTVNDLPLQPPSLVRIRRVKTPSTDWHKGLLLTFLIVLSVLGLLLVSSCATPVQPPTVAQKPPPLPQMPAEIRNPPKPFPNAP